MLKRLLINETVNKMTPGFAKKIIRNIIPYHTFIETIWEKENKYIGTEFEWKYDFGSNVKIGIIYDLAQYHRHYIAACIDLKKSYEVFEIHDTKWIGNFMKSQCQLFLVWPTIVNTLWKKLFDDRLYFLTQKLGKIIFPCYESLWLYENKSRVRDFCLINGIKIPQTEIFYRKNEALEYIERSKIPVVLKLDQAAASLGVWIVKSRSQARQMVRAIFHKGLVVRRGDPRDRRWGQVIFQEYLPNVEEWRITRVGDNFFCRFKHKKGDFHSGSGVLSWGKPDQELLDYVKIITDTHNLKSVAVDLFVQPETKEVWVNEIQAMFGERKIDDPQHQGNMGRYQFVNGQWQFEHGYFYTNACANLRLEYALESLDKRHRVSLQSSTDACARPNPQNPCSL